MKIGDIYYEKHTVVGISKRTNTVSETDVEIVNVLPIDVFEKIRSEIEQLPTAKCTETRRIYIDVDDFKENVLAIFDKYMAESEET